MPTKHIPSIMNMIDKIVSPDDRKRKYSYRQIIKILVLLNIFNTSYRSPEIFLINHEEYLIMIDFKEIPSFQTLSRIMCSLHNLLFCTGYLAQYVQYKTISEHCPILGFYKMFIYDYYLYVHVREVCLLDNNNSYLKLNGQFVTNFREIELINGKSHKLKHSSGTMFYFINLEKANTVYAARLNK